MNFLQKLLVDLEKEAALHANDIYNYAIPQAWNLFGFSKARTLRNGQLLVNPYDFYMYTFTHMFFDEMGKLKKSEKLSQSWLKQACIYSLHIRSTTCWDHDRDDCLEDNIYRLKDTGTFVKAILLLPMYKRMGINTILLHTPFALGRTYGAHEFTNKECVMDFRMVAEELKDPLIPQMTATEQCKAFIEACHQLGFRVILEYCPGKISVDHLYVKLNPESFYWIKEEAWKQYHAPVCSHLPQNTLPYPYALRDLYHSEDVLEHISKFADYTQEHKVIAPAFSDQINANIPVDWDATYFRFYLDKHKYVPADLKKMAPYITQDSMRYDLYPAKQPTPYLWEALTENIIWFQDQLHIDGIYLEKPYLLPEKLQKQMAKAAKKHKKQFVMIVEDTTIEHSEEWLKKGYDMISGNSAYEETQIKEFKFHSFAYQLKGNRCPMFAASESYDSRRVSCLPQGQTLANLLSVMNLFLPNGIPMYMSGIETYEVAPMQLSEYGDSAYNECLSKQDIRYHRQSYIDRFFYQYTNKNITSFLQLMEKANKFRQSYIEAITNVDRAIPVWFDSPQDAGIGYTFILEDKALMVVCNTNVYDTIPLHIHTENMLSLLPFHHSRVLQSYTTHEPYTKEIYLDIFQNIPLDFAPGEVKFIEFS